MRAAKVQASLRMRAVSPEPSLLAHTSSESRGTFRQKARSLAPLNGWACAVKICHDGMLEDTNSLDGAHVFFYFKWKVHVLVLRALWHVPRHRSKLNLNFEILSISTTSVFWAQSLNPCKNNDKEYFVMKWQRTSWTMVKLYNKVQWDQISHFGAPAAIKERLNLLEPCLEKYRVIPLYVFIETILALILKVLISVSKLTKQS